MFSAKFGLLITAMVTPFKEDLTIDYPALENLIEHLIKTGTSSLLITGTTGENPTLSHDEEWELLRSTKAIVKGRVPIIFGAGSNSTVTAVETSLKAQENGAEAIMSVSPYYNKPNQEGVFLHFAEIAKAVKVPILLYNNPGRTCSFIEVETVKKLNDKHPNICAIKESSGQLDPFASLNLTVPKVEAYCGDDNLTLPAFSVGSAGVVSVASHLVGTQIKDLIENFQKGKIKEAKEIHYQLFPLFKALFSAPSPGPVKYLLSKMRICKPYLRLPLTEPAQDVRNTLDAVISQMMISQGY